MAVCLSLSLSPPFTFPPDFFRGGAGRAGFSGGLFFPGGGRGGEDGRAGGARRVEGRGGYWREDVMTRRWARGLEWVGVARCGVALGLGLTEWLLILVDPMNQANCDGITAGRPQTEAESILGGPGFRHD